MPVADGGVRYDHMMQFFKQEDLPDGFELFGQLAQKILELPSNPERTMALRKLLEAKDCAERAVVFK